MGERELSNEIRAAPTPLRHNVGGSWALANTEDSDAFVAKLLTVLSERTTRHRSTTRGL